MSHLRRLADIEPTLHTSTNNATGASGVERGVASDRSSRRSSEDEAITVSVIGVTVAVVVVGEVSITRIPIIPVAVVGVAAGADVDVDLCGCISGCKHRRAEQGHCDRMNSQ